MVSLGTVLIAVGIIAVVALLYLWPEIFGRMKTEYFQDIATNQTTNLATTTQSAPASSANTLPISSMSSSNLLQAIAVPKFEEGFQSGSVNTNFNDGNGQADSTATSDQVVGGGYNIQPMDNSPMNGTAAGAGSPVTLDTNTPPLANVVIPGGPLAGSAAGAGALMTGTPVPVVGYTTVNSPSPLLNGPPNPQQEIPSTAPTEMNVQVLNSGQIPIGDVTTGSYASEDPTSTPSFTVAVSQLDSNAVDNLKTNLASGGQYTLNITCDIPNISYSFPLSQITNVSNESNQVYAYTFQNNDVQKPGPMFTGANTLNFQVVQTAPLPTNAPNAPPPEAPTPTPEPVGTISQTSYTTADCQNLGYASSDNVSRLYSQTDCDTLQGVWAADGTCSYQGGTFNTLCAFLNTQVPPTTSSTAPLPTPPNAISSNPPSTMASVLPATAIVSPTNAYTFTNQSIMMDASTLAQKIRSAELMIKCNSM